MKLSKRRFKPNQFKPKQFRKNNRKLTKNNRKLTKNNRFKKHKKTKLRKLKKKKVYRSQKGGGIFSMLGSIASLPFKPIKMAVNTAMPIITNAINSKMESNTASNTASNPASNAVNNSHMNNQTNNQNSNSTISKDMELYNRIIQNVESININNANITALKQLSDNNMTDNMPNYINHLKVIEI